MAEHLSDEEQAEALKKWLDDNKNSLIGSVILALVVVFGYQGWQTSVQESGEAASVLYEDMTEVLNVSPLESLTEEQAATLEHLAGTLKAQYDSTSYGTFAALHMARLAVERDDLEKAEEELRWALSHAPEDAIAHVARQRLARVLLARGEADAALELVESEDAPGFQSAYSEIRGDIYVSQGKQMQARQAYQLAIENQPEGASNPILEMKLSDLPLQASVLQGDDGRDSLEALVTAPVEAVTEDAVAEETAAEEVAAEEATPDVEEKADSAESSNGSGS